jgi:iron complex outermembrane receptor protein
MYYMTHSRFGRQPTIWLTGLLGLFVFATQAWAAPAADPLSEDMFLGEVPVILSATRLAQSPSESPASITVIDRRMIDASGVNEIPDLFRLVPGYQVGHVDGSWSVVTSHGLSDAFARRMQVLVDGRSVYTSAFGGVQWSDLALSIEDIDRIEVIRGPNAATYGANSFAGVINIITRHPNQDQGAFVKLTHGSYDTNNVVARYGAANGPFTFRLTAGYHEDEGFPDLRDDNQTNLLTFRGEYRINARDTLDIQAGANQSRRDDGRPGDELDLAREEESTNNFQYLRWRHIRSASEDFSLLYTHDTYNNTDKYQTALLSELLGVPPAAIPILFGIPDQPLVNDEGFKTERYNIEFQHTLSPRRDLRLVWGAEARLDRMQARGWLGTSDWVEEELYRLFTNAEWRFATDWILNAGLMYEDNSIVGGTWSPRVAVNHHVTPNQTVRASASRALRTPSMFENSADASVHAADGTLIDRLFLATRSLQPEEMTSFELGYIGTFPQANLTVDVKLYREAIRRIVTAAGDDSITDPIASTVPNTFYNDGEANIDGVETQIKWRSSTHSQLILTHAYAFQSGQMLQRVIGGVPTYTETDLSTPELTTSLLAIQEFSPRLEGSLGFYHVSNMEFFGGDETGGFATMDARLAWKLRSNSMRGEVSLVGQNLLNSYFDFDGSAGSTALMDRRFYINLALNFR